MLYWNSNQNIWIAQQPPPQDNMQPYLGINFIIALQGLYPSRNSDLPFIGEIFMFAGNFAPRGFALCDGQLLYIYDNTALFSILGITYGGDGLTTFALPDLRGRVPVHSGQGTGPGLTRRWLGQKGGVERH
jgi:microcystin-dependent protein